MRCANTSAGELEIDRWRYVERTLADPGVLLHEGVEGGRIELLRQPDELGLRLGAVVPGETRHGLILRLDDDVSHGIHGLPLATRALAQLDLDGAGRGSRLDRGADHHVGVSRLDEGAEHHDEDEGVRSDGRGLAGVHCDCSKIMGLSTSA